MIIGDIVTSNARLYPDKLGIVDRDVRYTWKQVDERTNGLANALTGLGLNKGDRVAIISENNHRYAEFLLAVAKNGLIGVGLSYRFTPQQLATIINDCNPRAILVQEKSVSIINETKPLISGVEHFIGMGQNHGFNLDYEALIDRYSQDTVENKPGEDDIYLIIYTTGTTGAPKGAIFLHRSLVSALFTRLLAYRISAEDIYLVHGPLYLAGGLHHFYAACVGSCTVVIDTFSAQSFLEMIEREKVDVTYLLPIHYRLIREYLDVGGQKYDLSSLRKLPFGGGQPASAEQVKEILNFFGVSWSNKLYSMTEGLVSWLMPEDVAAGLSPQATEKEWHRLNSIGKSIMSTQVRVVDDNDEDVPPGETGEILVKSEGWAVGYWNNPELTKRAFRGGWYHTTDLGTLDEDGYLYFMGRKDTLIKSGGFFIAPKQVEDTILKHQSVYEVAVLGFPDEKWGQVVKAVVSLKTDNQATEQEIRDHCRQYLASYQVPKTVVFVDNLPKDPVYGKVSVKELLKIYGGTGA